MTTSQGPRRGRELPGLTACGLCTGETLGSGDPLEGGQRARLDNLAASGVARVRYVECLDECERGDVVVARPTAGHRERGIGPTWFERLAGDELTGELREWLRTGGPGACPLPKALRGFVIEPTDDSPRGPPAADPHSSSHHHQESEDPMTGAPPTAIDPVCGMSVNPETAAASAEHEGAAYYFCTKGCQKSFLADPSQYV